MTDDLTWLITPEQMREMDRRTIVEVGLPGSILMDRAARGAVDAILRHFDLPPGATITVFCGTGNNGGDGLAMASMLANLGFQPQVIVLGDKSSLSPDAALYLDIAAFNLSAIHIAPDEEALDQAIHALRPASLFIDALLGTGLDRPLTGRYRKAVDFLNTQNAPLVAVDIPSGINARTGQILGAATRATLTTTFAFAKIGHLLDPARQHCGHLDTIDIGIPLQIRDEVGLAGVALDKAWVLAHLKNRPLDLHKGGAGRTLHIGGRPQTAGAIILSARAALAAGAGLITAATDRRTQPLLPSAVPEIMSRALFDEDSSAIDEAALQDLAGLSDAIVIGPGLGQDELARQIFHTLLSTRPRRLIIDADALNLLANNADLVELLKKAQIPHLILTPHPGEASRLLKTPISALMNDPIAATQELARRFQATVALTSAATIIASPDERLAINTTGNPGMATGGMGDALTGIIAATLADFPQDSFTATAFSVAIHGMAGDMAATHRGHRGLSVTGLLDSLPSLWHRLGG